MSHTDTDDWNIEQQEKRRNVIAIVLVQFYLSTEIVKCMCNWLLAHQKHTFSFDKSAYRFLFYIFFGDFSQSSTCIAATQSFFFVHKSIVFIVDTTNQKRKETIRNCNALSRNEAKSKGDKYGKLDSNLKSSIFKC